MSIWLKLLALMALAVSFITPAQAGMCNKHNPNWNPETKTCPEKPVVLRREPAAIPRVEPPPPSNVVEVFITPSAASAPAVRTPVPSLLMSGVSAPSLIRSPALPPLTVVACGQVTSVGGVIGTNFISPTTPVQAFGRIDN